MLYFITGNKHKFAEAKAVLPELEQLDIDLPEIQEINPKIVLKAKLEEARKLHQGNFVVEDTSLYLECINGLPGPLFKWFFKAIGREGVVNLTKKMGDNRVEAKTEVAYYLTQGGISYFEGVVKGYVVDPRGESGFGWDPIFMPEGFDKTYAQVNDEEKAKIGMDKPRKLAFEKLKEYLNSLSGI